jgi:hypothetical protein
MSKGTKVFAVVGGIAILAVSVFLFGGFAGKPNATPVQARGYQAH